MLNVSAMKTNNPVLIGGALLANVSIRAAKVAFIGAFATAYAAICAVLIALYVFSQYAIEHARFIGLCVVVISAAVLCFALPQVAVAVLLVVAGLEVIKQ